MRCHGRRSALFAVAVAAIVAAAAAAAAAGEIAHDGRRTYIVHCSHAAMPSEFAAHGDWYASSLQSVSGGAAGVIYTYDTLLHGYSARLTRAEARALEAQPGVLLVNPETRYELHTTRTPEFLGLDRAEALFPESNAASDVIVGVLDTGVWPERPSYDDAGFGPVPAGWKGKCEGGSDFNSSACNRKLIGARYFLAGYEASKGPVDTSKESRSPRDNDGHGTHTSSTAAGSSVRGADLLGYASGTAKGMAPRARVATYKVCWVGGCFSSDILKGMEVAVADGVDVLSLSLGDRVRARPSMKEVLHHLIRCNRMSAEAQACQLDYCDGGAPLLKVKKGSRRRDVSDSGWWDDDGEDNGKFVVHAV